MSMSLPASSTPATNRVASVDVFRGLMYLLPDLFYSALSLLGIDFLKTHLSEGWGGVARSAGVALFLMGVTVLLTRLGIRLKV